jgi:hypothetical protein
LSYRFVLHNRRVKQGLGAYKKTILLFNEQKDWANFIAMDSMLGASDHVDETVNEIIGQLENLVS